MPAISKTRIMNKTQKAKLVRLVGAGQSANDIAEDLSLPVEVVEKAISRLKSEDLKLKKVKVPELQEPSFRGGVESGEANAVSEKATSVDELLDACDVDRNHWAVKSFTVETFEKGINDGQGNVRIEPVYEIAASLVSQPALADLQSLAQGFEKQANEYRPTSERGTRRRSDGALMYEINIADLHLGKLAWGEETGEADYDTPKAANLCAEAIYTLAKRAPKGVEKILLPIGNDFFNVDSMSRETTGGTPQDEDGRWQKTFQIAVDMLTDNITKHLMPIAPVEVIIVPGNHDTQRIFYMGVALSQRFFSNERVSVDNTPRLRKYHVFGENLIGFTHGDKEKVSTLHNIMAHEQPRAWARTSYREVQLGHLHTEIIRNTNGLVIRNLSSLSSADAWHASNGYKGNVRKAEGFVFKASGGLVSKTSFIAKD